MRGILAAAVAVIAICRMAYSGELGGVGPPDPSLILLRPLIDLGALGVFVVFLLWDRKREMEKRAEDGKRWYALDQKLICLVETCTRTITESTSVMAEIRSNIHENTKEVSRMNSFLANRVANRFGEDE